MVSFLVGHSETMMIISAIIFTDLIYKLLLLIQLRLTWKVSCASVQKVNAEMDN